MSISFNSSLAVGCLGAIVLAAAACTPKRIPPMTVTDLLEDRVKLDGVLIKCNRDLANARLDLDCINARIAVERLASKSEAGEEAKRSAEFERAREQLRLQQDKARRQYDANTKVDVYHLPLIPVDPAPAPRNPDPPVVGQANQ